MFSLFHHMLNLYFVGCAVVSRRHLLTLYAAQYDCITMLYPNGDSCEAGIPAEPFHSNRHVSCALLDGRLFLGCLKRIKLVFLSRITGG